MPAAAPTTEFGTDDGDDLHPGLAQQRVGVRVAVIGEHHAGRDGDEPVDDDLADEPGSFEGLDGGFELDVAMLPTVREAMMRVNLTGTNGNSNHTVSVGFLVGDADGNGAVVLERVLGRWPVERIGEREAA